MEVSLSQLYSIRRGDLERKKLDLKIIPTDLDILWTEPFILFYSIFFIFATQIKIQYKKKKKSGEET